MVPISYSPFIRMEGRTISESYADKTEIFYNENGEVIDVKMTAIQSLVTADIPCGGTGNTPFTYVTEVREEVKMPKECVAEYVANNAEFFANNSYKRLK